VAERPVIDPDAATRPVRRVAEGDDIVSRLAPTVSTNDFSARRRPHMEREHE
jgi:hypothetical protein